MPYTTPLPDSFLDLSAETPILTLPPTFVLNDLGNSTAFAQYDVEATSATTLEPGDELTLVDADGNPVDAGTFAGTATLTTATGDVSVLGLAGATIQINPIPPRFMSTRTAKPI